MSEVTWYLLRSTGVIALALLSLSVVLGIAGPTIRKPSFRLLSVWVHTTSALAGVALLVGHIVLAVLDSWVDVSALSVVVPGASAWEPLWIGLGALAVDLLAVVVVSSAFRRQSAATWWRLHILVYPAWVLAWLHALGVGTDATSGLMKALAIVSGGVVAGAATVRRLNPPAAVGSSTRRTGVTS